MKKYINIFIKRKKYIFLDNYNLKKDIFVMFQVPRLEALLGSHQPLAIGILPPMPSRNYATAFIFIIMKKEMCILHRGLCDAK
jgi:hypothetical protein